MQSDWNDHAVTSRMDPPQRPVVPMPGQMVDFPLADQEEDDDATVVGSDDEQEAAAQSTLQEEVPRQDVPRQDVPVIEEVVNYDPSAPAFEIITIED